jgi:uncharacterized protein YndB with AHSA1/START domain
MASFTFEREFAAPPEVVFDVLTDHRGYAEITPLRRSVLEREGDPAPNGVGAIRVVGGVGTTLREEVLAYDRPRRFSYTVLSGAPIRSHLGTVELSPSNGGTRMVYSVRMIPTVPFGGRAVIAAVKFGIKTLIDGISAKSERLARESG